MSTAWRIGDRAPGRTMDFHRRSLEKGASIGLHGLGHDEIHYVVSGAFAVTSDGTTQPLIVSYPLPPR